MAVFTASDGYFSLFETQTAQIAITFASESAPSLLIASIFWTNRCPQADAASVFVSVTRALLAICADYHVCKRLGRASNHIQ